MVKRLATSPHDPLGITDSACKNQLVMVSVQYGPLNTNIPIRTTSIGKSRVARDPITMHTSRRSNSDIAYVTRQTSWSYDICEKLDLTDISTSWLATSWKWGKAGASKQLEEQERTAQAQLQTKSGADAEVSPEDQLEDENKEAGEEKERALQELMKQPT
ncbi:hypothetical protein F511_23959 [Dorcoceras hygrometricum]|uniref:Uncharacterized protein n=1 Tax=Dorcoceras hygrometricum TaxID=472368 RepID=A0A2Z7B011_9LAMI|nr:hypothetical protein F511_23959 [Dorcoceras hygrometricum]